MRILLSTIGSRGDVQPLVAIALQRDMAARAQSSATTVQRNGVQTAAQRLITPFYRGFKQRIFAAMAVLYRAVE